MRPLIPATYLAMALVLLLGFRVGLNLTSSNVIDVGYSGVIGADRLAHGEEIYGNFPEDNAFGDTYGPFNYIAYVPFELIFPWHGQWDDLPAAHAASLFFDLSTILGLFLVGRRLRPGPRGHELGIMLAYAWAAFPYTLFVLNTNANDSLLAALLVYSFLFLQSSRMRGGLLALAGMTKFAPLALGPLYLLLFAAPEDGAAIRRLVHDRDPDRDAARAAQRRPVGVLGPHRRVPARARVAVQHLGAGAEPGVASDDREGAGGRPGRAGGLRAAPQDAPSDGGARRRRC